MAHNLFRRKSQSKPQISRDTTSMFASLAYEQFEERKMLSVSPGTDLGGHLDQLRQQLILNHLSGQVETAYLQQGTNDLQLIQVDNGTSSTTAVFQQLMDGIPVYGRRVAVVQGTQGEILSVEDRGAKFLTTQDSLTPSVDVATAQQIANQNFMGQDGLAWEADLVWFKNGQRAELAWRIQTVIAGANVNNQDLEFTTIVDANSSDLLSQTQSPTAVGDLINQANGIHPRIVINDAIGPAGSQNYGSTFDSVVALPGCTGTLVAPNVIISARHCGSSAGDNIRFGDDSNNPDFSATVQSVQLPAGPGTLLDGGDVSILILEDNVPGDMATPVKFIDRTDELVGEVAATVGYGLNGVGSTGHGGTSDGIRWGGENIIDVYGTPASAAGANIISTDFDDGTPGGNTIAGSDPTPLEFEATTAPGDSGGPIMIRVGEEWVIAGVLSGGTSPTSQYGDISWWTGTAIYRDQIEAVGGMFVTFGEIDVTHEGTQVADGSTFDFGVTELGTPVTRTFTVTNEHPTGDLELFEPISVPDEFTVVNSFGQTTLAPGESTTFDIRFDSNPFGSYSGEVSFESGDADENPFNFTVTATVAPPIGEADSVLVEGRWKTVFLKNTYIDPVVVAGPATSNEAEPVTVRVRNVTADSFQIRVHEWQYLDRSHAFESVSYVVMESGTHRLTDGTTIIASNTSGVSTDFVPVQFDLPFEETPVVLTQTTTVNGGAPVVTRVGGTSENGFQVKLQEEEAGDQTHTPETVSWLAFLPSNDDLGVLTQVSEIHVNSVDETPVSFPFGEDTNFEDTPVFLAGMQSFRGSNTATVRLTSLTNTQATIFVEEEQSRDEETGHGHETIGFLALEQGDIIGTTVIGEAGHINNVDRTWQTIQLNNDYIDPVIVFSVNSINEADPGVVRVRNVTGNSFQVHFEEWNYLDLNHAPESASYIVFEAGIHRLRDGTVIEARNSSVDSDFTDISFANDHETTPHVFSQVTSDNGPATITTRMRNITPDGFEIKVQEEEASETIRHVNERISWIALETASGDVGGLFYEAKQHDVGVNHRGETVFFTNFFDDPPAVISDMQTFFGDNTATTRQTMVSAGRVDLFIEEEQSLDTEIGHGREDVAIFAISTGLIDGYIVDLISGAEVNPPGGFFAGPAPPRSSAPPVDGGVDAIQQMLLARSNFDLVNDSAFEQLESSPLLDLDLHESPGATAGMNDLNEPENGDSFLVRNESKTSADDQGDLLGDMEPLL